MKYGTKEFNEVIELFEKSAKNEDGGFYIPSFSRTDKDESKKYADSGDIQIYNNGETNKLFQVFMIGVSAGKSIERFN